MCEEKTCCCFVQVFEYGIVKHHSKVYHDLNYALCIWVHEKHLVLPTQMAPICQHLGHGPVTIYTCIYIGKDLKLTFFIFYSRPTGMPTGFEIFSLWQGMVELNHISYIPHMYSDVRQVSNRSLCGCYSYKIYCRKIGVFRRGMYISIDVQLS